MKCVDCDHKYCEFCNAGDKYQKKSKANVVTNFERIKAMSILELANFFSEIGWEAMQRKSKYPHEWEKWLESEVQEDE